MNLPETAMVLAAGLGTRMKPLTDHMPKPLVPVAGRALIDYTLDRLAAAGVRRAVVNLHYMGEMLERHLAGRSDIEIRFSPEEDLLETGGGVRQALPLLGETFFVINSDALWFDGKVPALHRLARAWDPARLDALLLMQRTVTAVGYDGLGDFIVDPVGGLRRRAEREVAPHLFAGIEIMHRRLFDGETATRFSLNRLFDRAIETGRIGAIVHDGEWCEVGTLDGLALTEERIALRRTER